MNSKNIIGILTNLSGSENLAEIKKKIETFKSFLSKIHPADDELIKFKADKKTNQVSKSYLLNELNQILKTRTLQRTRYYINRLIKSLTEERTSAVNDINLNRWKEYDDIITDSLWLIEKRDQSGAHKADYWGNFIPQIPNQFLRRYTKKDDWILDAFAGSGTTLIECKRLGRNGIGVELNPDVVKIAKAKLKNEKNPYKVETKVITGNSGQIDIGAKLKKNKIKSVQFILLHPPYWDIIKFSKKKSDLSNASSVDDFLNMFGKVIDNTSKYLEKGRYLAVVIGDKYSNGEWIPLGFYTMQEVMKRGFKLKSTIVKNFDTTKGKMNQKELWRYRALAGGFYIFKHEYIFLFQK